MTFQTITKCAATTFVAVGLAGCVETTQSPSVAAPSTTPSPAEQACLAAVSNATNNGDVSVLSSEFSQAGTDVKIGVGPSRAPWRCIAYSDGSTAGIESLTNEGSL